MKAFPFLVVLAASALPAFACQEHSGSGVVPPLYATKAEAEKAAPLFNCAGAHQMGNQWMPCGGHPKPSDPVAVPPLYATKAEAEKAAPLFNCVGAHQMGNKWMPCSKHGQVKTTAQ
jgi:Protein of unknown function